MGRTTEDWLEKIINKMLDEYTEHLRGNLKDWDVRMKDAFAAIKALYAPKTVVGGDLYDEYLDALINAIDSEQVTIGSKHPAKSGKHGFEKTINNDLTHQLVAIAESYAESIASRREVEARIKQMEFIRDEYDKWLNKFPDDDPNETVKLQDIVDHLNLEIAALSQSKD